MSTAPLVVANWKMNMPFDQAYQFGRRYFELLSQQAARHKKTVVVCPDFVSLAPLAQIKAPHIALGAQTCSSFSSGAYTGQVSAESLKQVGCTYCIIGHSERRILCHEKDELIAQKSAELISHEIIPILCIGETHAEHTAGKGPEVLTAQLTPVLKKLSQHKPQASLLIAYEPIWAIGTGLTPTPSSLEESCSLIRRVISTLAPQLKTDLLYGGSVTETNAPQFLGVTGIAGLLVGGASTDFQKLEKIVCLD